MFESAQLKIQRADHHISDLEAQLATFKNARPYTFAVGNDSKSGQTVVRINFRDPIPKQWALVIGDAIHNLHTALDHMTWVLAGSPGSEQNRHIKLPTGDSRASFENACNGMKMTSQAVRDILKTLEVFPGGKGNTLYALHKLDIADKHFMLMPVIREAKVSQFAIYNADKEPISIWKDTRFIVSGDTGHINVMNVPSGGYVELEEGATVTPDIVIGKINPEGGYLPVIRMLRKFHGEVSQTLGVVESLASKI